MKKTVNGRTLQLQIMNRIGRINGRTCAVGNDFVAVDITGGRSHVLAHFGEDRSAAIAWIEAAS